MKLTREQVNEIVRDYLSNPSGLDELLGMMLEVLMQSERALYNESTGDVSNGYRPRKLLVKGNVLELRVPRTRQRGFMPVILGILKHQEEEMYDLASYLYSKGSSHEDISGLFSILYGKSYSTSQVNRLVMSSAEAVEEWRCRPLPSSAEALMIDATYIPVRRGGTVRKEPFFVVMGLSKEGRRAIYGVYNNPTEGSGIWGDFFEDLKSRGLKEVGLLISDGLNNIEEVAQEHFPGVEVQLCTVHLQRNICKRVRSQDRRAVGEDLKAVFRTDSLLKSPSDGLALFQKFSEKWGRAYPYISKLNDSPRLTYYFTYLKYESHVRSYIKTTNWVERFYREVKKGSRYKCALPSVESAIRLVSMIAINSRYLERRIGDLSGGLIKLPVGAGELEEW